jgi:hypothetical protein
LSRPNSGRSENNATLRTGPTPGTLRNSSWLETIKVEAQVILPALDISGPWCGVINGQNFGSGQINLSVVQKKNLRGVCGV